MMLETGETIVVTLEEARERVQRLATHWNWPEPAILENIVALGEDAIAPIQELLTPELMQATHIDEEAFSLVYYCMGVLSVIGSPRSIPTLVDLFRWVDDELIEWLPDFLCRLGPAAIESLLLVTADSALEWYPRAMAANAAVTLAGTDTALRERVAAELRSLLAGYVERTDSLDDEEIEVVSALVADLTDLADPLARPLIMAAFDGDKVDFGFIGLEDVEGIYAQGGNIQHGPPEPFLEQYRKDYEQNRSVERLKSLETASHQPYVSGRRLGRNDPCWCDSGKKYKKCHLAQDEQARRTDF